MRIFAWSTSEEELVARWRDTDPFQIPMRNLAAMEILQTLGCPIQLSWDFNGGSGRKSEVTYQLQPVCGVLLDELHDVPAFHPL